MLLHIMNDHMKTHLHQKVSFSPKGMAFPWRSKVTVGERHHLHTKQIKMLTVDLDYLSSSLERESFSMWIWRPGKMKVTISFRGFLARFQRIILTRKLDKGHWPSFLLQDFVHLKFGMMDIKKCKIDRFSHIVMDKLAKQGLVTWHSPTAGDTRLAGHLNR